VAKIGDVVKLITDIASQTNLLALNATIEAARAGEAGKGFSVVANEVKNLASQTARATQQIAESIESVQAGTERAVQAIHGINAVISEVSEISVSVAAAVEEQNAATSEIARSVEKTSNGTAEVSESISSVTEAARDTGAAASQIAEASHTLSQHTGRLQKEVNRFVAQMRADKQDIHLLEWTNDMALGVAEVDAHHRAIIGALNAFAGEMLHGDGATAARDMLRKMQTDMEQHFAQEEQEMQKRSYPGLPDHRKQHQEMLRRMEDFGRKLSGDKVKGASEFFEFCADWFKFHIQKSDGPFIAFAHKR
jgi:methyl-accepting chemotaxis protein